MHSQGFSQIQKQTQTFTPQLRQSLEILQVSALELRNLILKELQSNPVLEEHPTNEISFEKTEDFTDEFDFKEEDSRNTDQDWSGEFDQKWTSSSYTSEEEQRRQHFLDSVTSEKSLQEYIVEQAKFSACTDEELAAMEFLIGSLDDKGFLLSSISELSKLSGLSEEALVSALEILKYFDPVGLGAKDVQECLLIQLNAVGQSNSLASKIIKDYYPLLLKRRIPELAKNLSLTVDHVQKILEEIAVLDPAPGRRFKEDHNRTVVADASIEKVGESWSIKLNNEYIPRLRLSKTYKDLIVKGQLSSKEEEYLRDKMRSGKFILNAIEQRQKTLQRVTDGILNFQQDFFENGISALRPLTMNELAQYLKLHETTIGRAIADKFLETPHGLFPYKYFFTSGYNVHEENGSVSSTYIKEKILRILQSEPSGKPYSDQKIAEILSEKGIKIARRTVTKYREELGVISASLRRKY